MKLKLLEVLSEQEIRRIHDASVHVLGACGVKVYDDQMLGLLRERGLHVSSEDCTVRFTAASIEDALSSVCQCFDLFNREGEFAFTLGGGTPRIAAGHNAVFWVDSATGQTRPSTVADVERFARICEQLPAIDMIGIPVMPQDVPEPRASLLHGVRACIENSRKPIYFSTDKDDVNRACIELLRAAFAGDLPSQPYGISQLSPTSPLYWEHSVVRAMADTVEAGVPLAILPEPNAGVSAPYTLAGLLTVSNTEWLSGLVMTQLLKPGARVLYANSWTVTDMRSGAALVGSTETSICRIAGAQMARFYRVPSHTTAPNSDNHAHDEQNAWEKTLSVFCSAAAGNDLIVNCGMFATGMTCSDEQLVMDEEMSAMALRIGRGMEVTDETLCQDLIERIGPNGGSYLTADETLSRLRAGEFLDPRVSVRGPRASWQAAGSPDTYQLARGRAAALAARPAPPLEDARSAALDEVIRSF